MKNLFRVLRRVSNAQQGSASTKAFAAHVKRADQLRDLGRKLDAAEEYARALEHKPAAASILVQLGNMSKDTGQHDRAITSYSNAIHELVKLRLVEKDSTKLAEISAELADAHLQRGHAYKLASKGHLAAKEYAAAAALNNRKEILHELKVAEATWGEQDKVLSGEPVRQSGYSIQRWDAALGANLESWSQCICYSQNLHRLEQANNRTWLVCRECGTTFNDKVTAFNATGRFKEFHSTEISESDLAALEALARNEGVFGSKGLVGAVCTDQSYDQLSVWPGGFVDGGLVRMQYDLLVVPALGRGIADIRGFLGKAFQLLKPGGRIVLGFQSKVRSFYDGKYSFARTTQSLPIPGPLEELNTEGNDEPFFRFNAEEVRKIAEGAAGSRGVCLALYDSDGKYVLVMERDRAVSVGVMSGIGDAVWSFQFVEALRQKYQADRIVLHVHDSADHRRKRSNGLLKRFSFIDDVVSSVFHVHADPPMNELTGHIRYRPEGNTRLYSTDTFDYRLIVNTHLEHGRSLEDIAQRLGLDAREIKHDLFADYQETQSDVKAWRKIAALAGGDYVVFHYGALIDNTEVGLNRGGLWSKNDWNELGELIHRQYGCRIVLVGAPYDQEFARQVQGLTDATFYINTIGQLEINETIAVMRRSKFLISFPSGIGILGPFLDVPTVVFWRDQNDSYHPLHEKAGFERGFASNWVSPDVKSRGTYYSAWYGHDTPQTVFDVIEQRGWFRLPPKHRHQERFATTGELEALSN